jgi:hypothetical protein
MSDIAGSLVCIAMPSDSRVTGLDADLRVALRAGTWLRVGSLEKRHQVTVRSASIPSSQASLLIVMVEADGRCRARDSGHNFRIRVNDQEVSSPRVLAPGDIIETYIFDEPLGLRFRFDAA